jgi:O-antigen/teichoic acid export membrane protein
MEDSLKKRYFFKLSTNLVGFAISLVTQAIIPRGLGPKAYGDFNFLTNFFMQVVAFLDMGTSLCFYTKLAQRPREATLISFYFYFFILISLNIGIFLLVAQTSEKSNLLWPNQTLFYISCAAVWGILTWFIDILGKMADAYGITVSTEMVRMTQKVIGLPVLIMLFFLGKLSLTNFFFYHYGIMFFLIVAFIWVMNNKGYSLTQHWRLPAVQVKAYVKEFFTYSHPLFSFALIAMVAGIFDRWLLQIFCGSVEQGFFGLSMQIGALCFLFTSAMAPLLTREFAIAHDKGDLNHMVHLFQRYLPLLYSIAAYFSCFIAVQAKKVVFLMGGRNFAGAVAAVAILAFYPIHQTYGQLTGAFFYATGKTALYRNVGIIFLILGLPMTYFLIAPGAKMGLDAGAMGLSIKMVLIQVVAVNVLLYFSTRYLGLSFWRYLRHQLGCVASLLITAWLVMVGVDHIPGVQDNVVPSFLIAGLIYSVLVLALCYVQPMIFGMKREDVNSLLQLALARLR